MVAVVLRGLGWWRTAGDPQGVHPPAAPSGPGRANPPERRGLRPESTVTSTHGERPLMGVVLGSTPYKLLHRSPVPVLVVRVPDA